MKLKRSDEIVVHSMQEMVDLLKNMKDTENISIRIEYEKDGDASANDADGRPAVAV